MKTCCLTGHRPKGFPWNYEDKNCEEHKLYLAALREKIINLISNDYKHFIAGGALGADSDFAEIIIELPFILTSLLKSLFPAPIKT